MSTPQKLELIQKILGLPQTQLANKLGVSFVAFNRWWTGKANPRAKSELMINELFLEVTGQKTIPQNQLEAKKQVLTKKASVHKNVLQEILENPDIRDQFILKLTYHSNSIEGSTLTESDTAAIIFNNTTLPNKSLTEHLEAKNHQTALNYLFGYLHKKKVLDTELILKLHSILMNGVLPDAGFFRNHDVRITGVNLVTSNHLSVPRIIHELLKKAARRTNDPINLATEVHEKFEQIHPFSDGNGRIGRLLLNAMLLKENIPPAIIKQEQKRLYYTYLYKAQTKEDQSQLEDFFCEAVLDGFIILTRTDVTKKRK